MEHWYKSYKEIIEREIVESYDNQLDEPVTRSLSSKLDLFSTKPDEVEVKELEKTFYIADIEKAAAIYEFTKGSELNQFVLKDLQGAPQGIQNLNDALLSLPTKKLTSEHHVYCGLGDFDPSEATDGDIYTNKIFMSTSLDVEAAIKNTNFKRHDSHVDYVLHIQLPEGYEDGWYIAPYSKMPEELEYMIFPDTTFKVIDKFEQPMGEKHTRVFWTLVPN